MAKWILAWLCGLGVLNPSLWARASLQHHIIQATRLPMGLKFWQQRSNGTTPLLLNFQAPWEPQALHAKLGTQSWCAGSGRGSTRPQGLIPMPGAQSQHVGPKEGGMPDPGMGRWERAAPGPRTQSWHAGPSRCSMGCHSPNLAHRTSWGWCRLPGYDPGTWGQAGVNLGIRAWSWHVGNGQLRQHGGPYPGMWSLFLVHMVRSSPQIGSVTLIWPMEPKAWVLLM